eukprot:scaffold10723_cov164-Amphora_coffeaeformis.AAC.13
MAGRWLLLVLLLLLSLLVLGTAVTTQQSTTTTTTTTDDCSIGPDGSQVCVVDSSASASASNNNNNNNDNHKNKHDDDDNDDDEALCSDKIGTDKCTKLFLPGHGCIEQFPLASVECRKTCQLCDGGDGVVLTADAQLSMSVDATTDDDNDQVVVARLYSAEFPQRIEGEHAADTYRHLQDVDQYMYETVYRDEEFRKVRTTCQNQHALCTFWAMLGECDKNPKYMQIECAPSCFSCDQLIFENRCPLDHEAPTYFTHPGELNAMFERILTEPSLQQYQPVAMMRPNPPTATAGGDDDDDDTTTTAVKEGPWIVVLENFLTDHECDTLIQLGAERGYERSKDVGERKADGTYGSVESKDRTSTNAWCVEECWDHAVTQSVHDKLELLTGGIPRAYYEYLQLLRYGQGEFYGQHHDYIEHHLDRQQGPRESEKE